MRIALVTPGFPPDAIGGTEIASQRYAEALARRGHDVLVLTRGERSRAREETGYQVQTAFRDVHLANIHTPSLFRGMLRAVRDGDPDILHCQAFFGHTWFCVRSRRLMGVPVLAYGRGSDIYLPDGRVAQRIVRDILKGADAVVAQTAHMAARMREIHPREVYVVPNGVDIEKFRNERTSMGGGTVLYIGRFRPEKNVPLAIRAFTLVRKRIPEAEMLVAGNGPEREVVARAAEETDGVLLVGDIPHDDVPDLMAKADVLLLSSDTEGFPMTLLEAMASGLPIVCTAVDGVPEIIQDGVNGSLAPPGDAAALAKAMERILTNEDEWLRISRQNALDARRYSWDSICERMEAIYETMVADAPTVK